MRRVAPALLSLTLFVGLGIATRAVQVDYQRYFLAGGQFWQFGEVTVTNPLQTPCLYGAIAFFIAFVWSVRIALAPHETRRKRQVGLNWLLVASTIFAWSNFIPILVRFYCAPANTAVAGCSSAVISSPWRTFCFGGSAAFLLALIIGLALVWPPKKSSSSKKQIV